MRLFRTLLSSLFAVGLAACGGGGALPAGTGDFAATGPNGNSAALEQTTLWVGYQLQINAFTSDGSGAVTPEKTLPSFPWASSPGASLPGIVDVAVAPDATQWILENRSAAEGGSGWRLYAIAPGGNQPENSYGSDVTVPFAVGVGSAGIMVGYRDSSGSTTIATYPFGASNAPAIYTFQSTTPVLGFSEGSDGNYYVARPNGFDVYTPDATGCCPVRSIVTATPLVGIRPQEFAVGPDNSIYVTDLPSGANQVVYVNVYPPGSGNVGRRIGPLPAQYDGLGGFPVITVDAKNRLYIATKGQIYRFGPTANGADAPERLMTDSTRGRPVTITVGPKL